VCKVCAKIYAKKYNNRRKIYNKTHILKKKYGISYDEWIAIIKDQKQRCLICNKILEDFYVYTSNSPVVDHNHETGKIRGILCNKCNRGLGYFDDNIVFLKNAVKYLGECFE